jgi:hypothetical protein
MKRIEDIDPNFRLDSNIPGDYVFHAPHFAPFSIYGIAPNPEGVYCRLPMGFLPECSEGVQTLAWHLAGACVRFSTDSDGIAVVWKLKEKGNMAHFTACGQSGLQLFEESDTGIRQIKNFIPAMDDGCGCRLEQSAYVALPGGMRSYALYLPLYNGLDELLIGISPAAKLAPGRIPAVEKPILYYGSSITQGGCASKVGNCYNSIVARRLDAAQWNLGFSGNGKGEENMARYIASQDMSVFVMDYDHNATTLEDLQATHEKMFRTIREAQPDLPVILMSRPKHILTETEEKRRVIIDTTYKNALAAGDKNVYFLDGPALTALCGTDGTVDHAHPTDFGFASMAKAIGDLIEQNGL